MVRWFAIIGSFLLGILPGAALSHPHEFVTMQITAKFDNTGAITGFRYNWTFDEFFSAYAMEGQDANKNGEAEQAELDALIVEVLGNIRSIDYFTKFDPAGTVPEFGTVVPVSASLAKRQVTIVFDLPFKAPVSVKEKRMRYAIYDDEFYIAMMHADAEKAVTLQDAPKGCDWDLREPTPDEDVAAFASSLDKTQSGGTDLGQNFAEWVSIKCN